MTHSCLTRPKQKVKIITGWSNPGGSTRFFIDLTNNLNETGEFEVTLYGDGPFPINKCSYKQITSLFLGFFGISTNDIVITHFLPLDVMRKITNQRPKKIILSCHEHELYPFNTEVQRASELYDLIHFVSPWQRAYHLIDNPRWKDIAVPTVVIPPFVRKFKRERSDSIGMHTSIIGSIDENKQTHISILKSFEKFPQHMIHVYGNVTDMNYFTKYVAPVIEYVSGEMISKHNINYPIWLFGHKEFHDIDNPYYSCAGVFHYSNRETYGLIEAEAKISGTPFFGNSRNIEIKTDEEIVRIWTQVLQ